MNPWQMAQQIKHELTLVTWPGGSQHVVFGALSVKIFAGTPTEDQIPAGFPWALVSFDVGTPDEDDPDLIEAPFTIMSAAEVAGDPLGEHALIGGSAADLGKSVSRGVMELAPLITQAVGRLTGFDGAKIIVSLSGMGTPAPLGGGKHLALMEHTVTAFCTSALHYAAPQQIALSGADLTWLGPHCSDRCDFKQYRVVEKAGASPSTDPTDGTVVYTGAAAAAVGVASGGNTYTVFADYSSRKQTGVVEGSSSPEVGSYA